MDIHEKYKILTFIFLYSKDFVNVKKGNYNINTHLKQMEYFYD